MAGAIPRMFVGSGLMCLLLMAPMASAFEFKVAKGWGVPGPDSESYGHWAERNRFQIGDSLLFVYPAGKDAVLQVSKEDYDSCNTANPIAKFGDGNTVFTLDRSGPFFFISGVPDNCNNNEKLVVVVMVERRNKSSGLNQPTSPRAPSPASPPSPAPAPPSPTPESPPSPVPAPPSPAQASAPSSEPVQSSPPPESPATPPPPGPIGIVPSTSPPQAGESASPPPAPNAAPLRAMGMVGSAGALLGSLVFFVL